MLTKLAFTSLPAVAKTSGAQAYLFKSHTSGDQLDLAIRKAIATVGPTTKERPSDAGLGDRYSAEVTDDQRDSADRDGSGGAGTGAP